MLPGDRKLNAGDHTFSIVPAATDQQPPRTFWHVPAYQNDRYGEQRAESEADSPADIGMEQARVQQHKAQSRANGGADPEAAIDCETDLSAHTCRDELIDGRV